MKRIYDDVFPNEISEKYNMDNYVRTIYNDNGDGDPSNDLILQVPALEDLLNLSHPTDNVPAIFDRSITINSPAVFDNILASSKVVSISDSRTDEKKSTATLDIIEVIPSGGVFVDSNSQTATGQVKMPGKYWYYDSSNDGIFDSIFVVDEDNNIIGVGFDYDYNSYLEPNKKLFVNKHVIKTGKIDFRLDDSTYNALIKDSRVYLEDSKTYDGYYLEATFSDSLFDLWKIQYTAGTSQLINEVKSITSHQFIQAMKGRLVGDIVFQVVAQLTAYAVSAIVSSLSGPLSPILGPLAYLITYGIISAINAAKQAEANKQDITSLTTKQASYVGDITLSSKQAADELWGGSMTDAIGWSTSGTYTSIHLETDKHLFKGEVLLAARGLKKTEAFGTENVPISPNYEKQTRSYISYSDFDDDRLNDYFFINIEAYATFTIPIDNDINYMGNTIMYLEDVISEKTDGGYYNIFPYMQYQDGVFIPTLQFSGRDTGHPLPEFYRDYPIYLEAEHYNELEDEHQFYTIYKVYDASSQYIELIPENVTRSIFAKVDHIELIIQDTLGLNDFQKQTFKASEGMFTFNNVTGILILSDSMYNNLQAQLKILNIVYSAIQDYEAYFIFEVKIEKYGSTSDLNGMTQGEVNQIATMQAVEQNILEYMYQYRQAQKTQLALSEMFYTILVTTASTIITTFITLGAGFIAKKFSSPAVVDAATGKLAAETVAQLGKGATKEAAKEAVKAATKKVLDTQMKRLAAYFIKATKASVLKMVLSPLTESLQEVFLDPYLETIVSDIVAKAGGDVFAQVLISSFVEGGRETLSGSMSQFIFGRSSNNPIISTHHQTQEKHVTSETATRNAIENQESFIKVKPRWSSIIKTGASLLLATALVGLGGPMSFGVSLVAGVSAIKSFSKSFTIQKTILHNIILQKANLKVLGATPETAFRDIYINPNLIISKLSEQIIKSQGLSRALDRKIIYRGQILKQDKTLSAYGFTSGDSLIITGQMAMFGEKTTNQEKIKKIAQGLIDYYMFIEKWELSPSEQKALKQDYLKSVETLTPPHINERTLINEVKKILPKFSTESDIYSKKVTKTREEMNPFEFLIWFVQNRPRSRYIESFRKVKSHIKKMDTES
ncbi:hypothetical protein LCGC14_0586980 [marine sediment metagenome]|uniref:Ubiquitin-like domain-containing protein n=1 Tax=marine sediment metagenome TaxID=412755 RepID=A0A0F9U0U9_9ZZZZ|nr:hypothetical protein [archaeon]HEC36995.1 hypothetical protein [bacterium]